ncbi:helix-turn-helix transcriptional regulator [Alkalihalobacillus deserti]|uniref:helix-turn-helix transcriptional regulator n=1 Tax=Alkalihalobacillus deserti TaxID=2879466 RepID=UPI001D13C67E|nr:helix-turn-helix transcriptional regulator [Alkalihalobacillus deserti]
MKCNIKWLIAKSGLSQKEVAKKMKLTPQQINAWASGHKYPRMDKGIELCKIIDCNLDDLYDWKDE